MESWFAAVYQRVIETAGFSEKDLKEEAVVGFAYAIAITVVVVVMFQNPLLVAITAVMGRGAADPAAALSGLTRGAYRRLTKTSDEAGDEAGDEGAREDSEDPGRDD